MGQSTKRGGVHFSLVKSMLDVILSFKRYPSKSHDTIINDMYDLYKYYCIMLFNIHHPGQGVTGWVDLGRGVNNLQDILSKLNDYLSWNFNCYVSSRMIWSDPVRSSAMQCYPVQFKCDPVRSSTIQSDFLLENIFQIETYSVI